MRFSDILIIYLSLGAPSAVCQFFDNPQASGVRKWITTLGVFLVWPPKTFQLLLRQFRGPSANSEFARGGGLVSAIDTKQREISRSIKEFAVADEIFELRNVFERYVGLTLAAKETGCNGAEILSIAGRKDIEVGAICINRRNAATLARHQTDAGRSLIAAVEHAARSQTFPPTTVRKAVELAAMLGDTATEKSLREIAHRQNIWTEPVGESWKSEPNHKLTEQSAMQLSVMTTASSND